MEHSLGKMEIKRVSVDAVPSPAGLSSLRTRRCGTGRGDELANAPEPTRACHFFKELLTVESEQFSFYGLCEKGDPIAWDMLHFHNEAAAAVYAMALITNEPRVAIVEVWTLDRFCFSVPAPGRGGSAAVVANFQAEHGSRQDDANRVRPHERPTLEQDPINDPKEEYGDSDRIHSK
jgi:hypothetical protein